MNSSQPSIAIIGMASRFPGAPDVESFWRNLKDGVESVSFFRDEDLLPHLPDPSILNNPLYVKAGAVLEGVESFDAPFFTFTPREAEITDPQHRIFLECSWSALEDAGHPPESFNGAIGVYAGASINTYLRRLVASDSIMRIVDPFQLVIGNEKDFLATRVSYKLNLTGPSITVQTACSTSLVAVHLACQALLNGECDMAIAGGVTVRVPQKLGYLHEPGGITSPDGHCRAFDQDAAGTVGGNGAGVVVLRRLEEAIADRDRVLAVILGSAINNDGAAKVGYTAPSLERQSAVIREAQSLAGIEPDSISYIEAHGTGTPIGDPIEFSALTRAFQNKTRKLNFCGLGSVKTNIGHLDAAAGVAGLIKVVLALMHRLIPASLHFHTPNPKMDLAKSPFFVVPKTIDWSCSGTPRRAGVSSFGVGGTNAHVIVEEAPSLLQGSESRCPQLLVLSAKSPRAADNAVCNLLHFLQNHGDIPLADVAYTLHVGRSAFAHRRVLICSSPAEAIEMLKDPAANRVLSAESNPASQSVVFMFPGQGAQHLHMGQGLYRTEPVFREHVDRCAEFLKERLRLDIRKVLHCNAGDDNTAAKLLNETYVTQLAMFVLEYSLAQLWLEWGIRPDAMIGHSVGEYTAACLAGVFSLEDALTLIAERGRLMQQMPRGAMLAIGLQQDEALKLAPPHALSLAAVNTPNSCVLSGALAAVQELETHLAAKGITTHLLQTSHAFHSRMMEPVLEPFRSVFGKVSLHPPRVPFISGLTGRWISTTEATDPDYWVRQLREPVRFCAGLQNVADDSRRILLEVGPGRALSSFARQQFAGQNNFHILQSLSQSKAKETDQEAILSALGRMWLAGFPVDWVGFHKHEQRNRVRLPTYAFDRHSHWVDAESDAHACREAAKATKTKKDTADWFYVPYWRPASVQKPSAVIPTDNQRRSWLVFAEDSHISNAVLNELHLRGDDVTTVRVGQQLRRIGPSEFELNPSSGDYDSLVNEILRVGQFPGAILHLWTLKSMFGSDPSAALNFELERGFFSLTLLMAALAKQNYTQPCVMNVISRGVFKVDFARTIRPEKTGVIAACTVIPQEFTNAVCRLVDIGDQDPFSPESILDEIVSDSPDTLVARRGTSRWVPAYQKIALPTSQDPATKFRKQGVYLITGGFGRVGSALAMHLARSVNARLILVSRTTIPDPPVWNDWLNSHSAQDPVSQRIRTVRDVESLGGEVCWYASDVCNEREVRAALEFGRSRFGDLHGIIHAAGIGGRKSYLPISRLGLSGPSRLHFDGIIRAKVLGTIVLDRVLGGHDLDFRLCMSSLSSVLGGLGLSAYAAANVFMDAFVEQSFTGPNSWASFNWDGWDFRDEATRDSVKVSTPFQLSMTAEEGVEALHRALGLTTTGRLVVSTGDLDERIRQWVQLESLRGDATKQVEGMPHARDQRRAYVAPRDDVETRVAELWQEVLGVDKVSVDDDFFKLGGHSLVGLRLIQRMRDIFQKEIPIEFLFESPTIAELSQRVRGIGKVRHHSAAKAPLLTLQTSGTKLPFFCVHPIGGGVFVYSALARHLSHDRPFHGLQALALDQIGEEYDSVTEMAERYIEAVRAVQPTGPYMLGGFSFGGFIAFEMACQLHEASERVSLLALMDAEPIEIEDELRQASMRPMEIHDPLLLSAYGQEVVLHLGKTAHRWSLTFHDLEKLDPEQRLQAVLDELIRHKVLTADDGMPLLCRNLKGIRNRVSAMYAFRPRTYNGPITLFKANLVNSLFEELLATEVIADDAGCSWSPHCKHRIRTIVVPGEHNYMVQEPHVRILAERLQACIDEAESDAESPSIPLSQDSCRQT